MSASGSSLFAKVLTDVVILTENCRQVDPVWAASLGRWQLNKPLESDLVAVNSRYIDDNKLNNLKPPAQTIKGVANNNTRENGLRYFESGVNAAAQPFTSEHVTWKERGILLIEARISQRRGHQPVRPDHERHIRMRDEKRLGVVGNLFCAIGALYIVSVNTDVTKGIANGTMCRLVQIHVHNSASVRTKLTETGERIHAVYADEVLCLFFPSITGI